MPCKIKRGCRFIAWVIDKEKWTCNIPSLLFSSFNQDLHGWICFCLGSSHSLPPALYHADRKKRTDNCLFDWCQDVDCGHWLITPFSFKKLTLQQLLRTGGKRNHSGSGLDCKASLRQGAHRNRVKSRPYLHVCSIVRPNKQAHISELDSQQQLWSPQNLCSSNKGVSPAVSVCCQTTSSQWSTAVQHLRWPRNAAKSKPAEKLSLSKVIPASKTICAVRWDSNWFDALKVRKHAAKLVWNCGYLGCAAIYHWSGKGVGEIIKTT